MKLLFDNCNIFDSDRLHLFNGYMLVSDGRIISARADSDRPSADLVIDLGGCDVLPGLVDIHTHGRAGFDFNFANRDEMRAMARSYALCGTTSLLPTLASDEFDRLLASAQLISSLKGKTDGAEFLGVHLEGRYLNPKRRGAHKEELLAKPNVSEIERFLCASGLPCRISSALELDIDGSFARECLMRGATLSLGHTDASYSVAMRIFEESLVGFTHLYNAMPPLHHRDGGAVLAAFDSNAYCELICDGEHVSPQMVSFTLNNIGWKRLVLITDSMAATGERDGEYLIAGNPAIVSGGIARTPDGALAGSTLSLDRAVRNLSSFTNLTMRQALLCATLNPAKAAGIDGTVGALRCGLRADFLCGRITDTEFSFDSVYVGGVRIQ